MILTGKAKEDFEKYNNDIYGTIDTAHSNECVEFKHLNPELQQSVIVDWFDSVGIYINVSPRYIGHDLKYSLGDFYAVINFKDSTPTCSGFNYNNIDDSIYSRNEATKQVIIKANEIYNETNKTAAPVY